ncbi:MAG: hypothetical protein R3B06_26465 [Kofleriaceae bacterium]
MSRSPPAGNTKVLLTPPRDEQGVGRVILVTLDRTHASFRLRDWLDTRHAEAAGGAPAWKGVIVDGAGVACLETVEAAQASCTCGLERDGGMFAWGFIHGMDTMFYRRIGGSVAVANVVASLAPTTGPLP